MAQENILHNRNFQLIALFIVALIVIVGFATNWRFGIRRTAPAPTGPQEGDRCLTSDTPPKPGKITNGICVATNGGGGPGGGPAAERVGENQVSNGIQTRQMLADCSASCCGDDFCYTTKSGSCICIGETSNTSCPTSPAGGARTIRNASGVCAPSVGGVPVNLSQDDLLYIRQQALQRFSQGQVGAGTTLRYLNRQLNIVS